MFPVFPTWGFPAGASSPSDADVWAIGVARYGPGRALAAALAHSAENRAGGRGDG